MNKKPNIIFHQYLTYYQALLTQLDTASTLEEKSILELLTYRSQIQQTLDNHPILSPGNQQTLLHLDQKLKSLASQIVNLDLIKLKDYRQSLNPPLTAWWWYLENEIPPHPSTHYESLWKGLNFAGWTINLALLSNIISRFLSGGTGLGGAIIIVLPTLLTLLQARNDLTDSGNILFVSLLEKLGIKSQREPQAKLVSTGILTGIILSIWLTLPTFSQIYTILGKQAYERGELGNAETHYHKAIALNPDNGAAHYNLGNLYENINHLKQAKTEYLFAVKSGMTEANNNLGRLLIKEGQYSEAVSLLHQGLTRPEKSPETRYSLLKNLGWARLEQKDPQAAITYLESAIKIGEKTSTNAASAYCLLAQALEQNQNHNQAFTQWKFCCQKATILNPDEDKWLLIGRQKKIKLCRINH